MAAGRPRNVSPTPEQCLILGEEFLKWASEETKEFRCLVGQWYSLKKGMLKSEWKALIQIPEFLPYYESGMQALAIKAVDGTMKESFGHRYIRLYDRNLVDVENEQKAYESSLKREEALTVTQGQIDAAQKFNDQLSSIQSKAAATTSINDNKS